MMTQGHHLHFSRKLIIKMPNPWRLMMPWIESDAMQLCVLLLKAWLSQRYTKTELCQQFNISHQTADK